MSITFGSKYAAVSTKNLLPPSPKRDDQRPVPSCANINFLSQKCRQLLDEMACQTLRRFLCWANKAMEIPIMKLVDSKASKELKREWTDMTGKTPLLFAKWCASVISNFNWIVTFEEDVSCEDVLWIIRTAARHGIYAKLTVHEMHVHVIALVLHTSRGTCCLMELSSQPGSDFVINFASRAPGGGPRNFCLLHKLIANAILRPELMPESKKTVLMAVKLATSFAYNRDHLDHDIDGLDSILHEVLRGGTGALDQDKNG